MKTALSRYLLLSVFLAAFAAVMVGADLAKAADEASVTATVTVQNISVSVSDGSVAYGTIGLDSSSDTTSGGINDSQTATNDGNISLKLNLKGQNSAAWTLSGTNGADAYVHEFCTTTCDSSPSWTALTTSYQTLAASVAAAGTQVFDLKLTTPETSSSYTSQSVNVTVQAVLPD